MSRNAERSKQAFKVAAVTVKVAANVVNPVAGPVAQMYFGHPMTYQAYSQQLGQQRTSEAAQWQQLETIRRNAELGKRPNPTHVAGRDPGLGKTPVATKQHAAQASVQRGPQRAAAPGRATPRAAHPGATPIDTPARLDRPTRGR
jgi:hypothetical protein